MVRRDPPPDPPLKTAIVHWFGTFSINAAPLFGPLKCARVQFLYNCVIYNSSGEARALDKLSGDWTHLIVDSTVR